MRPLLVLGGPPQEGGLNTKLRLLAQGWEAIGGPPAWRAPNWRSQLERHREMCGAMGAWGQLRSGRRE